MSQSKLCIMVPPYKSMAVLILLVLFLGPIGLLYANFFASIIVLLLMIITLLLPIGEMELILIALWLANFYIGALAVISYNKKISKKYLNQREMSMPEVDEE